MASCSCWVLYCWCFDGRPLVYHLLGMVQTKPQRRRLPTQLTQRPVPALRFSSTTPLEHRSFIPQLTLPRATTLTPWSITLPQVTTPSRRRSTTWLRILPGVTILPRRWSTTWLRMLPILLHRGSQVLLCSQLLIAPIFLNTTLFQVLHRGSHWLLHRSGKVLLCPDLHNHNWGGQVLRSSDLLHRSCPFVLRWTEKILHWCSSLLHHDLRYT
jgi:hypothetical protein